jgi:peptidoglycan hydrolase-like protein with peptidoglycan-binding domain
MKQQLIKLGILPKNLYKTYIIPAKLKKQKELQKKQTITHLKLTFNRGFLLGEKNEKIKILQKYLKKLGFYKGPINGIYTKQTAEAVYKFQLKYNIIKGNENIRVL